MWIEYQDKDKEYQIGGMAAYRVNTISKDEMKMTVPMVMTDAVAKQVAELRLFELWAARSTLETALSFRFARLTPGDPIELVFADGRKQLMLIVKTSLGNPGIVKITAVSVGPTTYTYAGGTVKVTV
jgi:hypothetical protein